MAVAIIVIVIVIVLLAAAGGILLLRRRALRSRFGPEYDRLAAEVGPRAARTELSERQRRIAQLDIRSLSPERRTAYITQWVTLQEEFVDAPPQVAEAAGALVAAVAAERGYQVTEQDRLLTDLSVYHADRLESYRRARQTTEQAGTAETEDLRQAVLSYRALLRELLEAPDGASRPEPAPSATPPAPPAPSPAPPAPAPRTPEPDDADAPRTETGAWADIAAGTGARTAGDGSDGSEGSLDDRSASQATRKD